MARRRRIGPWWAVVFLAIGVVSTLLVLAYLFTSLERPGEVSAPERPPVPSADFLAALSGAVNAPVRRGGRAELLRNGDAYLPAFVEAIDAAERSVNWTAYIWADGEMSDRVLDAMLRAQRRGVAVRILLDHFGSTDGPHDRFEVLREAGGRVASFRPPTLAHLARYHRRNHRRAIVVDGESGFIGGAAIKDTWLGNARNADEWRDDMVRVTGPLARSLQAAFAQLWTGTTGEILTGDAFYPPDPPAGTQGEPIAGHVSVVSSPSSGNHPIRTVHWLSVASARERIWITNPYFVPDAALREILAERAQAGVDVRILTASENTDLNLVRRASHHHYEQLLEAGVRIFEFQPSLIHQKMLSVDGVWSLVSSANLDIRSEELNEENLLGILDESFAAELEASFEDDLARSEEVVLSAWRERGAMKRLGERLASLLQEQF